jgi:hypothetical protein
VNEMPLLPSQINPRIPSGFDHIISKALAKLTVDRYQSAKEFAHDLANYKVLSATDTKEIAGPKSSFFSNLITSKQPSTAPDKKETGSGTAPNLKRKIDIADNPTPSNKKIIYYGLVTLVIAFAITLVLYKDKFGRITPPPPVKIDILPPNVEVAPVTLPINPVPNNSHPNPVLVTETETPKPPITLIPVITPTDIDSPEGKPLPVTKPIKPKKTVSTEHKVVKHEDLKILPKLTTEESKAHNEEIKTQLDIPDNIAAVLDFAIAPWGEIYIDGKKIGISPPLKTFKVMPGKHIIEIKNTDLPSYSAAMELESQANKKIKHRFIILNDK